MTDTVTLAYVHNVDVTHSFHDSLLNLMLFDAANEQRVIRGGYIKMRCAHTTAADTLAEARNKIAEAFLVREADWLFMVDTDMGFAPDTLERLLEAANPVDRPIVGALCFAWNENSEDGMSGFRASPRPTIMDWCQTPQGDRFMVATTYPPDTVFQCAGTGAACILMHRSVFEKVKETYGSTWYTRVKGHDGNLLGEDVSFCVRVAACGFPIHVHTGVKTTHMKHIWVSEADYLQWFAWQQMVADQPPSADEIETVTVNGDDEPRVSVHGAAG